MSALHFAVDGAQRRESRPLNSFLRVAFMPDDQRRRRGGLSRYLNGGANNLTRRAAGVRENLEQNGGWPREQLADMNADFIAAMERAFDRGLERSPQQDGGPASGIASYVASCGCSSSAISP